MIAPGELKAQRRITDAFVAADAELITLMRPTRTSDGAGGHVDADPHPVIAQYLRLIPGEDGSSESTTAEGETSTPRYVLLGPHDADMERWDLFTTADGRRFQIVFINANRQYETKGEVVYLGS